MKAAFAPIVNNKCTILILGTMPGEESLRLQQYYGNRGNQFWKLLFTLFGETFSFGYDTRIALLNNKHIALWDVLSKCEREGSLDSNIKNEIPNDFDSFYKLYPKIKTVFFASKASSKYYDKYALRKAGVTYHTLPSPSGANAGKTFQQKLDEWKIILQYIH